MREVVLLVLASVNRFEELHEPVDEQSERRIPSEVGGLELVGSIDKQAAKKASVETRQKREGED